LGDRNQQTTVDLCSLVGLPDGTLLRQQSYAVSSPDLDRVALITAPPDAPQTMRIIDIATMTVTVARTIARYQGRSAAASADGRFWTFPIEVPDNDVTWYSIGWADALTGETRDLSLGTPYGSPPHQKGAYSGLEPISVSADGELMSFHVPTYSGTSWVHGAPAVAFADIVIRRSDLFSSRFE